MRLFKNLLIYRFDEPFEWSAEALNQKLSELPLTPCLSEEMISYGWLPAFSEGELSVEEVGHSLYFRLGIEEKRLPRRAVTTALERRAEELGVDREDRSRYKELEEVVSAELIKNAYPETRSTTAYIDREQGWLLIDASSLKRAEELTTFLRKTIGSLAITPLLPENALAPFFTHAVQSGLSDEDFAFLDEIELSEKSKKEGGTARYKGIPLEAEEIQHTLALGWQVVKIAFEYRSLLSFTLNEAFAIKRLRALDGFFDEIEEQDDPHAFAYGTALTQQSIFAELILSLLKMVERGVE